MEILAYFCITGSWDRGGEGGGGEETIPSTVPKVEKEYEFTKKCSRFEFCHRIFLNLCSFGSNEDLFSSSPANLAKLILDFQKFFIEFKHPDRFFNVMIIGAINFMLPRAANELVILNFPQEQLD